MEFSFQKKYYKNSKSIKYEAYYGVKNPDPDKGTPRLHWFD